MYIPGIIKLCDMGSLSPCKFLACMDTLYASPFNSREREIAKESEVMGTSNSIISCWFCVITKINLVAGTLLAVLSYDHENVTVADSSLKVLVRAVTDAGVPNCPR